MSSPANRKPLLLLVDDVPSNLKVLEQILCDAYRLKLATSGPIALNLAHREDQPDLILLDLRMPGMDGIEVLDQLRRDARTREIPVIFVTAENNEVTESGGIELGADDYVTKPVSPPVLLARIRGILRRKAIEATLKQSEEQFRTLFETMAQGVIYYNGQGEVIQANPAAEQILGIPFAQMKGKTPMDSAWPMIHKEGVPLRSEEHPVTIALTTGQPVKEMLIGIFHPENQRYSWILASAMPRFEPGAERPSGLFSTFTDITSRVCLEQELERLATTDPLTNTFNRRHFMETAENEVDRSRRYGRSLALIMLDIDHFKRINDTWGHPVGDQAIRTMAQVCQTVLRDEDGLGRLGGEEFAVVMPETELAGALILAERLRLMVEQIEIPVADGLLRFTTSIGVAALRPSDHAAENLLSRADNALYRAKNGGRNRVEADDGHLPRTTP